MSIVTKLINRVLISEASKILRPLGVAVVPLEAARPCAWGAKTIVGSFGPSADTCRTGSRHNYFIHDGYEHRKEVGWFDDMQNTDQSQREVYQFAKEICDREGLMSVVDIGCGSGYKLMKYLSHLHTIGIDLPTTCERLRNKYPNRVWQNVESFTPPQQGIDLVIASDVIEHVLDPDQMMRTISLIRPTYSILSTPDRNLLRAGTHDGPPLNTTHIREWSFAEFEAYVGAYFDVIEHFISCAPQATQCILCRPKPQ
jgi:hypothetical protein